MPQYSSVLMASIRCGPRIIPSAYSAFLITVAASCARAHGAASAPAIKAKQKRRRMIIEFDEILVMLFGHQMRQIVLNARQRFRQRCLGIGVQF